MNLPRYFIEKLSLYSFVVVLTKSHHKTEIGDEPKIKKGYTKDTVRNLLGVDDSDENK